MKRSKKTRARNKLTSSERFLMVCPNCKKHIEPITYFTGELYCPECKEEIAKKLLETIRKGDGKQAEVAEVNFSLSQQFFLRYLLDIVPKMRAKKEGKEFDELYNEGQSYLRQAVAYCKRAAYMGNSDALINLVYFYKSGYDVTVANPEIAAKKLSAVVMDIFAKYTEKPEIYNKVKRQLSGQVGEAPVLQGGGGLQYLNSLLKACKDKTAERKPLFGTFTVNCDKLSMNEKSDFSKLLKAAAEYFNTEAKCGLYKYNPLNGRWEGMESDVKLDEIAGIRHFGYVNVRYHASSRRFKRAAKEILEADEDKLIAFFTNIVTDTRIKLPDDNRTVGFSDVDIYLCNDENRDSDKIDDLENKLEEILKKQ